jgi:TetR/AcrR family transcriptional regulator, cholesterol catabolism regulator
VRRKVSGSARAEFEQRLRPRMARLWAEVYQENRASIKVKKAAVAVKNLEKIFAAALNLAQRSGFHAMSLRELSRASGLSMGALYSYFGSKDELRGHIFRYGARFAREVVAGEADRCEEPAERLAAAIRAHLYLSEALRPWFYFSYMEARNLPPAERRAAMENERLTEEIFFTILRQGRRRREFQIKQVELTAAVIKAMLQDWYLKRWKYGQAKVNVEEYGEFVVNFVLAAIGPHSKERKR